MNNGSGIKNWIYSLCIVLFILLASPVVFCVSVLILIAQGPPIIFRQKRTGKNGKPFVMYKFRTMNLGAERKQKELIPLNEAHGPIFKIHNDPRFTKAGKFLAHTGLDELPQFINVLKGDMALIGPRPLPIEEAKQLKSWQKARQNIQPGIISPWIVDGYHKQTFDVWMDSDIAYIKRKSFLYDLRLAGQTVILLTRIFFRELLAS